MKLASTLNSKINEDFWYNKLVNSNIERKHYKMLNGEVISANLNIRDETAKLVKKITKDNWKSELTIHILTFNLLLRKYLRVKQLWLCAQVDSGKHESSGYLYCDYSGKHSDIASELLAKVGETTQNALDHSGYDHKALREKLEANGIDPMYFENFRIVYNLKRDTQKSIDYSNDLGTTLELQIGQKKQQLSICSSHDFFAAIDPNLFLANYNDLLYLLLTNPKFPVGNLDLEDNYEDTKREYKLGFGNKIMLTAENIFEELFQEKVSDLEKTAIEFGDEALSYGEMEKLVQRLIYYFSEQKISKGTTIGVYMENSIWSVISCLAIMKSGAVYLPLDPNDVFERTSYKLKDSQTEMVVLNSNHISSFVGSSLKVFAIDIQLETLPDSNEHKKINIFGSDLAYIIYTSGSTGVPKGVKVNHSDLLNLVNGLVTDCEYHDSNQIARVGLIANIGFDPSIQQIFSTFYCSRTLVVVPEGIKKNGKKLIYFLNQNNIDRSDMTPSHLRLIVEAGKNENVALSIKQIWIGGEALSSKLVKEFFMLNKKSIGKVEIVNLYGLTECCVDLTYFRITDNIPDSLTVPIGKPLANREILLLDSSNRPTPLGGIGELAVKVDSVDIYITAQGMNQRIVPHPSNPKQNLFLTGDLCFWKNEFLHFVGRSDDQIKMNGFRIEPGEIKLVIEKYEHVVEAFVFKDKKKESLKAFIKSEKEIGKVGLSNYLKMHLPEYMLPSELHFVKEFPMNNSGKIDIAKLLAESQQNLNSNRKIFMAKTDNEKKILDIWSKVLGVEPYEFGIEDNFFFLGGNSLKAAKVVYELFKRHQIDIDIDALFNYPTISNLAKRIQGKSAYLDMDTVPKKDYYPTTGAQNRIWLECKFDFSGIAYNMPYAIEIRGNLDVDLFFGTINLIVSKHEILRTNFREVNGIPSQFVQNGLVLEPSYLDLSNEEKLSEELNNLIRLDFRKKFDLQNGPLVRFSLFKLAPNSFVLSFVMHHIIGDGWSVQLLLNELFETYRTCESGVMDNSKDAKLQYKDYANWLESHLENANEKKQFWREALKDLSEMNLISDFPRKRTQSYSGASKNISLDHDLVELVQKYASKYGMSDYIIIMSAYILLINKYAFQNDITIGYPVSGRLHPDSHDLFGCFVNMLPIRIILNPKDSFDDFLKQLKKKVDLALDNQEIQYGDIIQLVNENRSEPLKNLFNHVFVGQNDFANREIISGFEIKNYEVSGIEVAHFDLMLNVSINSNKIEININYSKDLFRSNTISQMFEQIDQVLRQVLNNTEITIQGIKLKHNLVATERPHSSDLQDFQF